MNAFSAGEAYAASRFIQYICFLQPLMYLLLSNMPFELLLSSFWRFHLAFYVQSGKIQVAANVPYDTTCVGIEYCNSHINIRELEVTECGIHNIADSMKNSASQPATGSTKTLILKAKMERKRYIFNSKHGLTSSSPFTPSSL